MDETIKICHVARIPYELRQRIFKYALKQPGTIGLQTPVWDDGSTFKQPLFAVSRFTRNEALEAFYKINTFLWHVNRRPSSNGGRADSDPSKYPLSVDSALPLTPSLPWHYPDLMKDVRYLAINVFLPSNIDPAIWSTSFPQQLYALVAALSKGGKLKKLLLTIIVGPWTQRRDLSTRLKEALSILTDLHCQQGVVVRTRPGFGEVADSIYDLSIGRRLRIGDRRSRSEKGQ